MRLLAALLVSVGLCGLGSAQQIVLGVERPKAQVMSLTEPQRIAAGKTTPVEMVFRVSDGFHVNSHTPRSRELIATELTLEPVAGLTLGKVVYPRGHAYHFDFDPKETLDVYTGQIEIAVPVKARAGTYVLRGALRYQACDNAMCYPPKDLPVRVELVAR